MEKKFDTLQWQCTQLLAKSLGLPASLEKVGKVLNLASDKRKLATDKTLIEYFSKPRKSHVKKTEQPTLWGTILSIQSEKVGRVQGILQSGRRIRTRNS